MTTLFGGWEPQIIVIPPDIPADPIIAPQYPIVTDAPEHITSTRRVSTGSGEKLFTKYTISDCGLAYALKDGQTFTNFTITDHVCDDHAGLIRVYAGITGDKLTIERISHLRGHYSGGVCAGVAHLGSTGARFKEVVMRNCNYERLEPIRSPGDIYGGILTAGGKPAEPQISISNVLIENCRSRNTFVDYSSSSDPTAYPNSDVVVTEKTVGFVDINGADFRFGSDAGIDMKGPGRIRATILEGFRESVKHWDNHQGVDIYSKDARVAHFVLPAGNPKVVEYEFAALVQGDPSKAIVDLQKAAHKLILQKGYFEGDPDTQVLAKAESAAFGSVVQLGSKSIAITKPITMLGELLAA